MSAAEDTRALERLAQACFEVSASYRLQALGVTIDGNQKVDFGRYPYVCDFLDRNCRMTTIIKGAQLGWSIAAILKALNQAKDESRRGILYLMPTHSDVLDFSKSRFGPLLQNNRQVWGDHVGQSDAANLREIGGTFLYFRGAGAKGTGERNLSAIKSLPIDSLFADERDEFSDARYDAARHRLDGSTCPEETIFSTPTLPGYGVDLAYQASDQRHWFWKCDKCNEWTCLELTFPDCIAEPAGRDPFYLCSHCNEELHRRRGQWIAAKPDVQDHRGYYVSQLSSPTRTPKDIIEASLEADRTGRRREYENQVLGRAYAEVEDQITEQQLLERQTEEPRPLSHPGPCAMGVDPGKPHWYEIRARVTENDSQQVARGRADSYEELARLAKRYNVTSGVMDQGYDPSAVASFVSNHKGWWGALYVNAKRTDPDWDAKNRVVKVGRDRLLDEAHHEILASRVSFYAKDDSWPQFVAQMMNLKRSVVEDASTGERKSRWVVTGGQKNDHLRHANAYAMLASQRAGLAKPAREAYAMARESVRKPRHRSAMTL